MTAFLPAVLIAAVVTFVATNIDDLVLLTGWFSDRSYRARHIAVGQFLGIAVLVAESVLLGLAGLFVPIPMMGIPWRDTGRNRHFTPHPQSGGSKRLPRFGGEERPCGCRGDYRSRKRQHRYHVPILATQTTVGIFTTVAVFFLMTGVWLVLARRFVRHPAWGQVVQSCGHRIVPWVLILLGASVVYEAGTTGWLVQDPRSLHQ